MKHYASHDPSVRRILPLIALLLALALLPSAALGEGAILYGPPPAGFDGLEVRFLDIGAGDSLFLRCGGQTMLIDGGVMLDGDRIFEYFDKQGIGGVDYMLNTHSHDDHINGLTRLLKLGFTAQTVLSPYKTNNNVDLHQAFVKAVKRRKAEYARVVDGDTMTLGGATLRFFRCTDDIAMKSRNENSLVTLVTFGERKLLLPADIGGETQRKLALLHGEALRADVVKSAHHGLARFVDEWLDAVAPGFVVCTGNPKNIPSFVEKMEKQALPVLYAPLGVVHLATDGAVWHIWQTGRMCKPSENEQLFPPIEP